MSVVGTTSTMPAVITCTISVDEARALTDRLKAAVDLTGALFAEARELEVWKALGYANFGAWATTEFGVSQSRAYQLADHAIVVTALREVTGSTMVELPERSARGLKPHLDLVLEEVAGAAAAARDQGSDERAVATAVTEKLGTVRMFLDEQKIIEKENKVRARRGRKLRLVTSVAEVEDRRRQAQAEARRVRRPESQKGSRYIDPVRCVSSAADGIVGEVEVLVSLMNEGLTSLDLLLPEQVARLESALNTMLNLVGEVPR